MDLYTRISRKSLWPDDWLLLVVESAHAGDRNTALSHFIATEMFG